MDAREQMEILSTLASGMMVRKLVFRGLYGSDCFAYSVSQIRAGCTWNHFYKEFD